MRLCPKCGQMKRPRPGGLICMDCRNAYRLAWHHKNKERMNEYAKVQHAKHKHKYVAARRKWSEQNPEKRVAYTMKWRDANREEWRSYGAMWGGGKRARIKNATPKWANKFFMREAYRLAALRTKVMGSPWHVDHIIPLHGKNVCGLHVENNLRVIPAIDNLRKHNKVELHG